jgi:hypothetical protein
MGAAAAVTKVTTATTLMTVVVGKAVGTLLLSVRGLVISMVTIAVSVMIVVKLLARDDFVLWRECSALRVLLVRSRRG